MAKFDAVLTALNQGRSVRREEWEPAVRMFVSFDTLMCQTGNSSPWLHSLTWGEVIAADWELFHAEPDAEPEKPEPVLPPRSGGFLDRVWWNPLPEALPRFGPQFFRFFVKWWNTE
jgi:hypothetical protein